MHIERLALTLGLGLALLAAAASAAAQADASARRQADWPNRPVSVVVPSSPGGGTDAYARLLAQALSEQLRQPFVVENKPGASGALGAAAVAKAEADGYTLLVASNSSLGINPVLYKSLPYDVARDFAPVTRGVIAPMVIVAHPDARLKTPAELLQHGRREPGALFYGSAGVGSPMYIGMRMIEAATGSRFNHVPYKGVAPAYQDLLAGRLQFMLTDIASVRPFVDSGKLSALALTEKSPLLPGVPTFAEAGLPSTAAFISFSVVAPARTPRAIVSRLALEIARAMSQRDNALKLEQLALIPVFDTPEQFAASLQEEQQTWGSFIRQHGITPE